MGLLEPEVMIPTCFEPAEEEPEVEPTEALIEEEPRLTKTQLQIIEYLLEHKDEPRSKAQIARGIGRCEKTVDRLMSKLRRDGYVVSVPRFGKNGAQLSNLYKYVEG